MAEFVLLLKYAMFYMRFNIYFFFFFPGELDYSVQLTSDRNQLIKQLSAYQRIDTRKSTVELQQKLYGILVNKHPIQERLQTLSSKEVKKLHTELKLKVTKRLTKNPFRCGICLNVYPSWARFSLGMDTPLEKEEHVNIHLGKSASIFAKKIITNTFESAMQKCFIKPLSCRQTEAVWAKLHNVNHRQPANILPRTFFDIIITIIITNTTAIIIIITA